MSAISARLTLRRLAVEAHKDFEIARIDARKQTSTRLLLERLEKMFAVDPSDSVIEYDEYGIARAVVDGDLAFEAPICCTVAGLYLVRGEQRIQVLGLVDLGRCLTEAITKAQVER